MKRRLIMGILLAGTVLGFGFGVMRLAHYRQQLGFGHGYHGGQHRRAAFERHVADLCTDAALRAVDRGQLKDPTP